MLTDNFSELENLRLEKMQQLIDHPNEQLVRGSYLADLDGAPFLEAGLSSFSSNNRRNLVFGFIRRETNEN